MVQQGIETEETVLDFVLANISMKEHYLLCFSWCFNVMVFGSAISDFFFYSKLVHSLCVCLAVSVRMCVCVCVCACECMPVCIC